MGTTSTSRAAVVRPHPRPLADGTAAFPIAPPSTGSGGELRYDNLVYSCEPGYRPLFLDLTLPPGDSPSPVIIWIHGGGWIYGSRRRLPPHIFDSSPFDQMLTAGFAVACLDYRLAREAGFAGMLLDIKAGIRWLRGHAAEFNFDPDRLVVWGESAGGHVAAMAGMCDKLDECPRTGEDLDQSEIPNAVVDWYGPTDLIAMAGLGSIADSEETGTTSENPAVVLRDCGDWSYSELSPISYVRASVPPIFLAHGVEDQVVPVSHSRGLVARLRDAGANTDYLEVPDADHVWLGAASLPDITTRSLTFVTEALR